MSNEQVAKDTVTIEVNGKAVEAPKGSMIIETTDNMGESVPRFCYHKKLPVAANCRMCLVEVENAPKPMPACATPVAEGMKIFTKSEAAIKAQKNVMEFLLINHPLDCPICDQGGECELQDVSIGYGRTESRFNEGKRVVKDKDIGPLVATEMTRCIHCTRCVRFLETIGGERELGGIGRGERTEIGTFVERSLGFEMAGNVIDICPVGALTAKPSRFSGRSWEFVATSSVAPHDGIGSNIEVHTLRGELKRVVPREAESINEVWISDRDRFSYEAVSAESRALKPKVKKNGEWQAVDWETALAAAGKQLKETDAAKLAALVSPSATVEEARLVSKVVRGLGSNNIDSRLRQVDFDGQDTAAAFPWLGRTIESFESLNALLLVGCDVKTEAPILNHRVRKATMQGAAVSSVAPVAFDTNYACETLLAAPQNMVAELASVAQVLLNRTSESAPEGFEHLGANPEARHEAVANQLQEASEAAVLVGGVAIAHPDFSTLKSLSALIARLAGATSGLLATGANAAGVALAGALPHRGLAGEGVSNPGNAFAEADTLVLLQVDVDQDLANSGKAVQQIKNANCVIAITSFESPALLEHADIILPAAAFSETSGTFVSAEGRWQQFTAAQKASGNARPAWKILRVLGNVLELEGFEYESSKDVLEEVVEACKSLEPQTDDSWVAKSSVLAGEKLVRAGVLGIYGTDNLVRRAPSLQATDAAKLAGVTLHSETAGQLNVSEGGQLELTQGESVQTFNVLVDDAVAPGALLLPAGFDETAGFGTQIGAISASKVN